MGAAHTILEHGGKCLLLDKSPFCGGNSTKATSGINGACTKGQAAKGIKDSNDIFLADTLKGGAKKPEVAKVLCFESGPGVDWLVDKFELDLSLIARMGGHSVPRCHRGKERFPGMKYYESGNALAKDMGIDVKVLMEEHDKHYAAAKKMEKDPDGGPFPAYPSGK